MAESVRFELTVGHPITSFQGWLLKPLGQLSIRPLLYHFASEKSRDPPHSPQHSHSSPDGIKPSGEFFLPERSTCTAASRYAELIRYMLNVIIGIHLNISFYRNFSAYSLKCCFSSIYRY